MKILKILFYPLFVISFVSIESYAIEKQRINMSAGNISCRESASISICEKFINSQLGKKGKKRAVIESKENYSNSGDFSLFGGSGIVFFSSHSYPDNHYFNNINYDSISTNENSIYIPSDYILPSGNVYLGTTHLGSNLGSSDIDHFTSNLWIDTSEDSGYYIGGHSDVPAQEEDTISVSQNLPGIYFNLLGNAYIISGLKPDSIIQYAEDRGFVSGNDSGLINDDNDLLSAASRIHDDNFNSDFESLDNGRSDWIEA